MSKLIVWLMFSLLFLAKPTVLLQIDVFCGSRAEVVLRPIFVTWLCRACTRTRGLISLKFSRPGTVCTVYCGSRADVVLRQYLLPDSVARVTTRGLNFIIKFYCKLLFTICWELWLQSRSLFLQFFLSDSFERFIQLWGLICAKFIGPWSVNAFCGSRAEVVLRQFDFLTVECFSLVWVLRLEVLSWGVWGVVFLLVVRCLGKYYSYVGSEISPSLSLGAWARLV